MRRYGVILMGTAFLAAGVVLVVRGRVRVFDVRDIDACVDGVQTRLLGTDLVQVGLPILAAGIVYRLGARSAARRSSGEPATRYKTVLMGLAVLAVGGILAAAALAVSLAPLTWWPARVFDLQMSDSCFMVVHVHTGVWPVKVGLVVLAAGIAYWLGVRSRLQRPAAEPVQEAPGG